MSCKLSCLLILLLLATAFCSAAASLDQQPSCCAPHRLLVRFYPGTPPADMDQVHRTAGAVVVDQIPQLGVQVVSLPDEQTLDQARSLYLGNASVLFAEPDYYLRCTLNPNDPYFGYDEDEPLWASMPAVWDLSTGSAQVTVAVLDSGADFSHPDLQGRLVPGWDFVDGDADPTDTDGHGTAMAGVLGAVSNNGYGVAALTWQNPVLVVRVSGCTGSVGCSRLAQGIIYAADQGARVINVSYGGPNYSHTLALAVEYANIRGALLVAGTGNEDAADPYYPAALPPVVAVAGVTGDGQTLCYPNYGSWVDVSAPYRAFSTSLGGSIDLYAGTSISAAYVTGTLGLMISARPTLPPSQAAQLLCETADDLGQPGPDPQYGWGKINPYRAVLAALQATVQDDSSPSLVKITAPPDGAILSGWQVVRATASDDRGVSQLELYRDGRLAGVLTLAPYAWGWDTRQSSDGQHTLYAQARDRAGNLATSPQVTVTVDNTPPTVAITAPSAGSLLGGLTTVTAEASDATSEIARVDFYLDGVYRQTATTAPYTWGWDTRQSSDGQHTLYAQARDWAGNLATSAQVTVTVDNIPPTVAITAPSAGSLVSGLTTVIAQASDTASGVARVDFYLNGVCRHTATTAPYTWGWDTTSQPPGAYNLQAVAIDGAGNQGTSAQVPVQVPLLLTTETFTDKIGYTKGDTSRLHPITLTWPGPISATLDWKGQGQADLDLYLINPSGTVVASSTSRSGQLEQISYEAPSAGAYTLRVVAYSGKTHYTLTVTHP